MARSKGLSPKEKKVYKRWQDGEVFMWGSVEHQLLWKAMVKLVKVSL